jgi:hypothetical protein
VTDVRYQVAGKTLEEFFASDAFVKLLIGPFGGGKTAACAISLYHRAISQAPGSDGVRRSRGVVIRNTFRQLQSTVVPSWRSWFDDRFGTFSWSEPFSHALRFSLPDGTTVQSDISFLALDGPDSENKLRGLECTFAWINEAREVGKPILDFLLGRVGRYPPMRDGGPTWAGVVLDTNPPDSDHYLYKLAEEHRPENWAVFKQPGGIIRSGDKWIANPNAENLAHLPHGYYLNQIAGQSDDWIRVHLAGEYGVFVPGRAVFPEYRDSVHCAREPLTPIPGLPLIIGIDLGLQACAVIGQRTAGGQWRVCDEMLTDGLGLARFGEMLGARLANWYPDFDQIELWADPAGAARSASDARTGLSVLSGAVGRPVRAASTNDLSVRLEAVRAPLNRMVDGAPGFLLSPVCPRLRKALAGGYHLRRIQVSGERYADKPEKDEHSHVSDACQYTLMGGGEAQLMVNRLQRGMTRPLMAQSSFNPMAT